MLGYAPTFSDRTDAGRRLADRLAPLKLDNPVIYALPRGGAPVAAEIARRLKAPLDLVLVRKIGAPGQPELAIAAVVDGEPPQTVVNESVFRASGATPAYLDKVRAQELMEIARRRRLYFGDRPRENPHGRTVVVVDDGLATGATALAAIKGLRAQGAQRVILAVPVAPPDSVRRLGLESEVVCLEIAEHFPGVGAFYDDFHQLTDAETIAALSSVRPAAAAAIAETEVHVPPLGLVADLRLPPDAKGVIVFAHGSGSSRKSPRNRMVAEALNRRGFATLLLDLLTDVEEANRANVFDIDLLAERLTQAVAWVDLHEDLCKLPLGLFGASTGAGAALKAAARIGDRVAAVVSRGGRPELAGSMALEQVKAATLLVVGAADHPTVIDGNRAALAKIAADKALVLVPHAGHLFEEPGAMQQVMEAAGDWFARRLAGKPQPAAAKPRPALTPLDRLKLAAEPLPDIDDPAFAAAFDRYADARVVLLGEASHGTSEFYRARAAITRRLIERHGFTIVAAEADWPDAASIDRYVRQRPAQATPQKPFSRFPTWMWRNTDVEAFTRWLRQHNARLPMDRRAGFYGLDLYNMRESMAAVLEYLDKVDPETAALARERYACLTPWSRKPAAYGRVALTRGYALCEAPVIAMLGDLLGRALDYARHDGERFFDATENARLVADAERYYRAMYFGAHESWNLRDRHMFETLTRVLEERGPNAKAVVWAHNSHIGDARFTEMGAARDEVNIGQLCREHFAADAALIGFGTHTGTVLAADDWDEPGKVMKVRPSRDDSYEGLCHQTGNPRFLIDLRADEHEHVRRDLREPRLERYIGVVYRPQTEIVSHYSLSSLPDQYDGFVWFDETRAVTPLAGRPTAGEDETYPFGV